MRQWSQSANRATPENSNVVASFQLAKGRLRIYANFPGIIHSCSLGWPPIQGKSVHKFISRRT
jgi:hypothetical protein